VARARVAFGWPELGLGRAGSVGGGVGDCPGVLNADSDRLTSADKEKGLPFLDRCT